MLPALLLALLVAAQLAAAGHALWSAALASRAGARAAAVGDDGRAAARRALPGGLREGARIRDTGAISVRVPIPRLVPGLPRVEAAAASDLAVGDG